MKISLCMIVKNEEKMIAQCLDSVASLVDEMIVVDTGSTDSTLDILSSYGDKLKIVHHDWQRDFSKARNTSLEKAMGDWILVLDADEKVEFDGEAFKDFLTKAQNKVYNIPIVNYTDSAAPVVSAIMPRLFKNTNPQYSGRVHEQLRINGKQILGSPVDASVIKIHHYGYLKENINQQNKVERNIELMSAHAQDHPNSQFAHYNLGVAYLQGGMYEKAIKSFNKSLKASEKDLHQDYQTDVVLKMMTCYKKLGQIKLLKEHVNTYKDHTLVKNNPKFHVRMGRMYLDEDKVLQARDSYLAAYRLGDNLTGKLTTLGMGSFMPLFELGRLEKSVGQGLEAIVYFMLGLFAPENEELSGFEEAADLLISYNQTDLLKSLLSTIEVFKSTDHVKGHSCKNLKKDKTTIEAYIQSGNTQAARNRLEKFKKEAELDKDYYAMLGIVNLVEGNQLDALLYLSVAHWLKPEDFNDTFNLAYCLHTLGVTKAAEIMFRHLLGAKNLPEDLKMDIEGILN